MINYLILHLLFIVYALNTVLGRMGVAYANRAAVVIWGILLAWLCLGEALSWTLAAGAALVIGGIILVSTEEAHE